MSCTGTHKDLVICVLYFLLFYISYYVIIPAVLYFLLFYISCVLYILLFILYISLLCFIGGLGPLLRAEPGPGGPRPLTHTYI